jgi:hypothetical protein
MHDVSFASNQAGSAGHGSSTGIAVHPKRQYMPTNATSSCTRTTEPKRPSSRASSRAAQKVQKVQQEGCRAQTCVSCLHPAQRRPRAPPSSSLLPSGTPSNPALTPPPWHTTPVRAAKPARIMEGLPLLRRQRNAHRQEQHVCLHN